MFLLGIAITVVTTTLLGCLIFAANELSYRLPDNAHVAWFFIVVLLILTFSGLSTSAFNHWLKEANSLPIQAEKGQ